MKLLILIILIIILLSIFNKSPPKYNKPNIAVVKSDKGRSVIATENIKKNTLIFVDTVTYYSDDNFEIIYNILNSNDQELLNKYFNLVPHTIDNQFTSKEELLKELNNSKYKDYFKNMEIDTVRLLYEKLSRNNFCFNLNDYPHCKSGLFIDSIYFNHSCSPNVEYDIINDKIYFYTDRDIYKGEELYISYIDTFKERSERKKELLKGYGFECNCELCNINY
jgi:SET domain-containing protein